MPYSKSGPFSNNNPPPFNAAWGNNLENYLNNGASQNGCPLFSYFGPYTCSTSSAAFSHKLKDINGSAVAPDVILLQVQGGASSVREVQYDPSSVTTTQFNAIGNGSFNFIGIAMKF